jgi:hypothetical protein
MPRIATEKQIQASRRNGARSRGPITPAGKAQSALNGFHHGRRAHPATLLRVGNPAVLAACRESLLKRFQPATAAVRQIVEAIATIDCQLGQLTARSMRTLEIEWARPAPRTRLLDYLAAAEDRLVRRRARLLRQLDGHRKQHLLNSENPGQVDGGWDIVGAKCAIFGGTRR